MEGASTSLSLTILQLRLAGQYFDFAEPDIATKTKPECHPERSRRLTNRKDFDFAQSDGDRKSYKHSPSVTLSGVEGLFTL
ncbi:hypothetical protein CFS9_08640 [Flavobacterium sp. CFS9]|uniref:Uncharacterized protein n=1 Tax=Flavobacterium sp. CFS9 TaxID=3143118 RepID=A0AAT9GXN3_9FLAO